jgi:hypothetical protein
MKPATPTTGPGVPILGQIAARLSRFCARCFVSVGQSSGNPCHTER